jgi:hypothetical protein
LTTASMNKMRSAWKHYDCLRWDLMIQVTKISLISYFEELIPFSGICFTLFYLVIMKFVHKLCTESLQKKSWEIRMSCMFLAYQANVTGSECYLAYCCTCLPPEMKIPSLPGLNGGWL